MELGPALLHKLQSDWGRQVAADSSQAKSKDLLGGAAAQDAKSDATAAAAKTVATGNSILQPLSPKQLLETDTETTAALPANVPGEEDTKPKA